MENEIKNEAASRKSLYIGVFILEVMSLVIFFVNIWHAGSMSVIHVLNDELGYWGTASYFAGLDWSGVMGNIPYYSYGYSLLLAPVLLIFGGGSAAYHAAVVLNSLLLVGAFLLSCSTARKLFPEADKLLVYCCCFCVSLYPAFVVNASVAWCEAFLIFAVWLTVRLFLSLYYSQRMWVFVCASLSMMLCYIIHQRALGLIIAGILCIAGMKLAKKISMKQFIVFISVAAGSLIIHLIIKSILLKTVFAGGTAAVNNYSGQLSKLGYVFSLDGIKAFVVELSGQIFYLGSVSFLLVFIGIIYLIRSGFTGFSRFWSRYVRKNPAEETTYGQYFCFFLALSCIFTVAISTVFLIHPDRWDHVVYGRYNEMLIGPVMVIGIISLFTNAKKSLIPALISGGALAVTGFALHFADRVFTLNTFNMLCSAGFRFYYTKFGVSPLKIFFVVIAAAAVIYGAALLADKKGKYIALVPTLLLAAFFLSNANSIIVDPIIPVQNDQSRIETALKEAKAEYDLPVYFYISGSDDAYAVRLRTQTQFALGKEHLYCDEDNGNMLIVAVNTEENNSSLEREHDIVSTHGSFNIWKPKN